MRPAWGGGAGAQGEDEDWELLGGDGCVRGPYSLQHLQKWPVQRFVNANNQVRPVGTKQWVGPASSSRAGTQGWGLQAPDMGALGWQQASTHGKPPLLSSSNTGPQGMDNGPAMPSWEQGSGYAIVSSPLAMAAGAGGGGAGMRSTPYTPAGRQQEMQPGTPSTGHDWMPYTATMPLPPPPHTAALATQLMDLSLSPSPLPGPSQSQPTPVPPAGVLPTAWPRRPGGRYRPPLYSSSSGHSVASEDSEPRHGSAAGMAAVTQPLAAPALAQPPGFGGQPHVWHCQGDLQKVAEGQEVPAPASHASVLQAQPEAGAGDGAKPAFASWSAMLAAKRYAARAGIATEQGKARAGARSASQELPQPAPAPAQEPSGVAGGAAARAVTGQQQQEERQQELGPKEASDGDGQSKPKYLTWSAMTKAKIAAAAATAGAAGTGSEANLAPRAAPSTSVGTAQRPQSSSHGGQGEPNPTAAPAKPSAGGAQKGARQAAAALAPAPGLPLSALHDALFPAEKAGQMGGPGGAPNGIHGSERQGAAAAGTGMCVICGSGLPVNLFLPCGHFGSCSSCCPDSLSNEEKLARFPACLACGVKASMYLRVWR